MKPHSRASAVSVFRLNLITLLLLPLFPAALFAQQTPYYPGPQQPYPTGGQYDPGEQYQQPYSQAQADQTQSDYDQPQPGYEQPQTLGPDQLDQMVAPIALNPDPLVALMLAASTYPAQVADADQWRQSQGNAPPDQIAYGANQQAWDPSVKALTAFPQVLAEMDQNIQWTVSLGTAYYNQPQDVLQAIQFMRQRAQAAGNLQNTPEQAVNYDQGNIELMPANSQVVYVPAYNPWTAYGQPVSPYPGFSLLNTIGSFFNSSLGSSALQFGVGTVMSAFSSTPWGLLSWGLDWLTQNLLFNHSDYYSNSNAVADWGLRYGGRRAWMRPHREFASYNRGYGRNYNRGWEGSRNWTRGSYNRGYQSYRYNRAQRGYGMRTNYGSSYRSAYGSNYNRREFGYGARAGYNSNLRFHDGLAHSSASGERLRSGYAYSNRSGYGSYRPPSSSFHQRSNGFMRGSGRPRSGGFYGGGHNSFGHQEGFKGPKFKAPKMRGGGHSFGGGHHSFGGGHHSFGGDHHSSGGGHSHGGHHR